MQSEEFVEMRRRIKYLLDADEINLKAHKLNSEVWEAQKNINATTKGIEELNVAALGHISKRLSELDKEVIDLKRQIEGLKEQAETSTSLA